MLISLDKNKWLYDWINDQWKDELHQIIFNERFDVPRPNVIRKKLYELLVSKGYKAKLTSKNDIIISIKDPEFTFIKLKYY